MASPDIISKISRQTKVYVLVAEAQEGQLSMSQMAELADALAGDPAERMEITHKALEKLIMVSMPTGRVEDLRRAFSGAGAASIPTPAPPPTPAPVPPPPVPAEPAPEVATQQTKAVPPAFKVPFPAKEAGTAFDPETEAEAARVADQDHPDAEHNPEVMDTGQFSAD
ncbi:MAG: hypothetical protein ACYTGB_20175, partial [Planctomycetota bacterium]